MRHHHQVLEPRRSRALVCVQNWQTWNIHRCAETLLLYLGMFTNTPSYYCLQLEICITGTHCHRYTITCAHHIHQHSFFLLYYHRCNQSHLLLVHIDHRRRLRQGQSYKMGSRQLVQLFSQLKTFHCWQSHDIHTRYMYIYTHNIYDTKRDQRSSLNRFSRNLSENQGLGFLPILSY